MANNKTSFSYYPVDTDRYSDIKIKRLKKTFGCQGIAVYDYILCEIYRDKGCFLEWDESTAFDVADYFGLKEKIVGEIVNYCCYVGLFSKELLASGRVLTSISIQRRFTEMCIKSKRKEIKIPEKIKIIMEESDIITEESNIITEVCDKVKKSKEKKDNTIVLSQKNKNANKFSPPTLFEVQSYCQERNNQVNPENFIDFYQSKGWLVGKNPMKDWRASVRLWERNTQKTQTNNQNGYTKQQTTPPPDDELTQAVLQGYARGMEQR